MNIDYVINGTNLKKKYKGFELSINNIAIPKGFATALIGENGAGKTTLLNMMSGIRNDYDGELTYFESHSKIDDTNTKERIGYTGPNNFFLPQWNAKQISEICNMMFTNFDKDRFFKICDSLSIPVNNVKNVKSLSDGNRMKIMLASVLARDTELLILDEPASPLDPVMRDRLNDIIRDYISKGDGEKSVFFSTHNIADMESVTDYAIIMHKGSIIEEGFVEELKEQYIIVKGEKEDVSVARDVLISMSESNFGFEGLCKTDDLDKFAGINIACEVPTLSQICVGILKKHSSLKTLI